MHTIALQAPPYLLALWLRTREVLLLGVGHNFVAEDRDRAVERGLVKGVAHNVLLGLRRARGVACHGAVHEVRLGDVVVRVEADTEAGVDERVREDGSNRDTVRVDMLVLARKGNRDGHNGVVRGLQRPTSMT